MHRKIDRIKNVIKEQEKALEQKTGIEANTDEDIRRSIEEVLQEVGKTRKQS